MNNSNDELLGSIADNLLELRKINKATECSLRNICDMGKSIVGYAAESYVEERFSDPFRIVTQQNDQLDLLEKSLETFGSKNSENKSIGIIPDVVDVLIELHAITAYLFFEISNDSMYCIAIGICRKFNLPDPDEILVEEIWEFRDAIAYAVTDITSEVLRLKIGDSTMQQELQNKCLMSKLAGERIPPDFYFNRLIDFSLN